MKSSPRHSMGQFVFTCSILILVFSAPYVNAVLSLDSPSFKIERRVNLEATLSCGKGMFQNELARMCGLSANEGRKSSLFSP